MASVNKKFMLANRISVFDFDFCAFTSTDLLLELRQNSVTKHSLYTLSAVCWSIWHISSLSVHLFVLSFCKLWIYSRQQRRFFLLSVRPPFWTRVFWHHIWCSSLYYSKLSGPSSLICQMSRLMLCFARLGHISANISFRYPICCWRLLLSSVANKPCLDACSA